MPPRRGRGGRGVRRMDAVIDHFTFRGYAARDIRAVVNGLLKAYEGSWPFLEDDSFKVVYDKLFEIEEEEKQKQDQQLLLEYHQQDGQQVEDEPPQHQEPTVDEEVEDPMFIEPQETTSISKVHNEVPAEIKSADKEVEDPMFIEPQETTSISKVHNEVPTEIKSAGKEVEDPMFIEPPAFEAALPLNAPRTGPRRPCYGWLSESEDEEEEQPTGQKHDVCVLSPGERAQ